MTRLFRPLSLLVMTGLLAPHCKSHSLAAPVNPEITAALGRVIFSSTSEDIPFELYGNLILIQVTINGHGPVKFILDSGAGVSFINRTRAIELGLRLNEIGDRGNFGIGEGTTKVAAATDLSFGLAGIDWSLKSVTVLPFDDQEAMAGLRH